MGGVATHGIAPTLYARLPFNPRSDFTFITSLWWLPNLLAVNLDVPAKSVAELIELCRKNPGKYSYGSAGSGTTLHLSGELFKTLAKVDIQHVPYRGSAPATQDLLAGQIHMMFDNIPGTLTLSRAGKVRPLGVTSAKRSPIVPEIPAIAETLPGMDIISWTMLVGPAKLSPDVVARLSELSKKALESDEVKTKYADLAATAWWHSPTETLAYARCGRGAARTDYQGVRRACRVAVMQTLTTAQAVVSMLELNGIDTLFCLPGVQNDSFFDALYDRTNAIRPIHARHEQACAYMALGYAMASGKPSAYVVVPGPASSTPPPRCRPPMR